MKFSAPREAILEPLQTVVGVAERRQTMPILSNVLLTAKGNSLQITATDLESEIVAEAALKVATGREIAVPGRKFHDICRPVPERSSLEVSVSGERATLKAGRSRLTLPSLRAN